MKLKEITGLLNGLLEPELFVGTDDSLNGLQVGDPEKEVKKVAFAVDACMQSFEKASEGGAGLLVVHHGLFWGKAFPLVGADYRRIEFLVKNNLALYACHLPLDAHPVCGNNAQIALKLGLENIRPFGDVRGKAIGCKGVFPRELSLDEIALTLGLVPETKLDFGKKLCKTAGLVSGGGAMSIFEASEQNLDVLITGEPLHQVYHFCKENRINMLCFGHYATETFGVKALESFLREKGLETFFVDSPTGL